MKYRVTLRWSHWFNKIGECMNGPGSPRDRCILQFGGGEKADFLWSDVEAVR